jgi:hypothetical protein
VKRPDLDLPQDQEAMMKDEVEPKQPGKYAKLPPRIRPEDMRTSQDVVQHADVKGEYDRETEWMLRTTGLFI